VLLFPYVRVVFKVLKRLDDVSSIRAPGVALMRYSSVRDASCIRGRNSQQSARSHHEVIGKRR